LVHLTEKRVKIAEKDDAKMVARVVAVESRLTHHQSTSTAPPEQLRQTLRLLSEKYAVSGRYSVQNQGAVTSFT